MFDFLFLAAGIVLLVRGADWFVGGAASLARYLRIPTIVIGLTIVALGTSLPEFAVSLTAAVKGSNGIALGNVLGSNLVNLLVVVGISGIIRPISIQAEVIKRDYTMSLFLSAVLLVLCLDLTSGKEGSLSRLDGLLLLLILAFYMINMIQQALRSRPKMSDLSMTHGIAWNVALCVFGSIAIICGGQLVVNAATSLARSLGLSENLIALTIVAIGTSLPELVTSVVAAKKGESEIALGNVLGSNIINIGFILGASAAIHPIQVGYQNLYDAGILLIISLLFFILLYRRRRVSRRTACYMILTYAVYSAYIILR